MHGIQVRPTGEATVSGTTIRRCQMGLFVMGKATIGKCSITACTESGVYAWKAEGGPGETTVEEGVVCEGNNARFAEVMASDGAPSGLWTTSTDTAGASLLDAHTPMMPDDDGTMSRHWHAFNGGVITGVAEEKIARLED